MKTNNQVFTLSEAQREDLHMSIKSLSESKDFFGMDEDDRFSVNTRFISKESPVYFDSEDSYGKAINNMIDYFVTCMNHKKSILADSLIEIGFPDLEKFDEHIKKFRNR